MTDNPLPPDANQPHAYPPPASPPPAGYAQPAPEYAQPPAPGYAQPGYPAPGYAQTPGDDSFPGKVLGIVGLILAFVAAPVGLILSIIAQVQSRKARAKNTPAVIGIIVGAILTVLAIIAVIVVIALGAYLFGNIFEMCNELGPGVWEVDGITYTCG